MAEFKAALVYKGQLFGGLIVMVLFTLAQYLILKVTQSEIYRGVMSLLYGDQPDQVDPIFGSISPTTICDSSCICMCCSAPTISFASGGT